MRKSLKKMMAVLSASALAMTLAVTGVPNVADAATVMSKEGKKAAKAKFDENGTYHAYFGIQQTETWIFRDEWYAENTGLSGKFGEGASFSNLVTSKDVSEPIKVPGAEDAVVTDAEITGNGVYYVSVEGLNGVMKSNPDANLAMIYVDTDIPVAAKETIKITDVKLTMDGMDTTLPEEIFFNAESESETGLIRFDPVNTYQRDQGEYPECPSIFAPNDSIRITFTVSGMAKDNPDAVEPTPTPAPESSDADTDDEDGSSVSPAVVGGIVVAVVVVIGAVVVVMRKKKN